METLLVKEKMRQVIDGELPINEFAVWYENWFSSDVHKESMDINLYMLLDDLFADLAYFEPNEKIRVEHYIYFGENKLLELIKASYGQIKAGNY